MEWEKFSYSQPPKEGIYWVIISEPEVDGDVDDYGNTIGWHTGRYTYSHALVHLFRTGENVDAYPVNSYLTGDYDNNTSAIIYYSELERPNNTELQTIYKHLDEKAHT